MAQPRAERTEQSTHNSVPGRTALWKVRESLRDSQINRSPEGASQVDPPDEKGKRELFGLQSKDTVPS